MHDGKTKVERQKQGGEASHRAFDDALSAMIWAFLNSVSPRLCVAGLVSLLCALSTGAVS